MIPNFDEYGNLPSGIHHSTIPEFISRFSYNPKRAWLLDGLNMLLDSLKKAGCRLIYIDGSFVTNKEIPGDYDLCWSMQGVDENKVDPILLSFTEDARNKVDMKYRGDVFPAELPEGASGLLFVDFFQSDKNTGKRKGIVAINIGDEQ